jgi:hypothetical protein
MASLHERLLALRAEIDSMLQELGPAPSVAQAQPGARFMKVGDFAAARGFSSRTIRDYCELGMPHRGEGKGRRVLVAEADAWIDGGGPRRARAARKGKAA